jgi:hypothetical protein
MTASFSTSGHVAFDDLARQALRDCGLAHAGITDIERIVLRPAAQDLHGAVDLGGTADQRVDLAAARLLVEVDGELLQRAVLLALAVLHLLFLLGSALGFLALGLGRALADTVADVAHGIETAHVLLLQEIDGIGLAFRKERDQHVGARHLILAGRLDVQDGALHDALETAGGGGVGRALHLQTVEFGIEIMGYSVAQLAQFHAARLHHFRRMFIVDQREQQMLQRRIFMLAVRRMRQRIVQCGFEGGCERRHCRSTPGPDKGRYRT